MKNINFKIKVNKEASDNMAEALGITEKRHDELGEILKEKQTGTFTGDVEMLIEVCKNPNEFVWMVYCISKMITLQDLPPALRMMAMMNS